jgi:hypothetical protein
LSEKIGWVPFFLITSVVALPAILLFVWIGPRDDFSNNRFKPALKSADGRSEDPDSAQEL